VPRRRLPDCSGLIVHVVNRSARRTALFEASLDYEAFLMVADQGLSRTGIELLAYCVMPNHFHFLLKTTADRQLAGFMGWFQATHAKRWRQHRRKTGEGCVYQGPYRAVAVQSDRHFLIAARYVERNPLRAGLVSRAEAWPWSSAGQRESGIRFLELANWPVDRPGNWTEVVNADPGGAEDVRRSVARGVPFGTDEWVRTTFGAPALRTRGRPRGPKTTPALFPTEITPGLFF
jgi:putative transposase